MMRSMLLTLCSSVRNVFLFGFFGRCGNSKYFLLIIGVHQFDYDVHGFLFVLLFMSSDFFHFSLFSGTPIIHLCWTT